MNKKYLMHNSNAFLTKQSLIALMRPNLTHLIAALIIGAVLIFTGVGIITTNNFFPVRTVNNLNVNATHTDWYATDYFQTNATDHVNVHVDVSGGSAKLVIREQSGQVIFGEVQGVMLYYNVPIDSSGIYRVEIWTRAIPFPSTYVNLTGTVALSRTFNSLYPMAYVASAIIISGLLLWVAGIAFFLNERRQAKREAEKLEKTRICPGCNKRVLIDNPVCPYCGSDITRSIQCQYCHGFYDRTLQKCPHCGAKKVQ